VKQAAERAAGGGEKLQKKFTLGKSTKEGPHRGKKKKLRKNLKVKYGNALEKVLGFPQKVWGGLKTLTYVNKENGEDFQFFQGK